MWWARSRAAQVFLTGTRLWWRGPGGSAAQFVHDGHEAALALVVEHATRESVKKLKVWLGGGACRVTMVRAVEGVRGLHDAEAALTAGMRARGLAQPHEVVRLTRPPGRRVQVPAVVIDAGLLAQIETLRQAGLSLQSVKPWWSALDMGTGTLGASVGQCLGLFDSETLTVVVFGEDGHVREASTHGPLRSAEEAQRILVRQASLREVARHACVSLGDRVATPIERVSARGFAFADRAVCSERL